MMQRLNLWAMLIVLALAIVACSGGGGGVTPPSDFTKLTAQVTDATNTPLAGMTVRVEGQATGVTTDATGSFVLTSAAFPNGVNASNEMSFGRNGVVMGTYEVVPATNPSLVIKLGSDAEPEPELGGVSGMVYDVETEEPLTGVELSLYSEEGGVYTAESGLDGYDFIGIPAGTWNLAASLEGYYAEMAVVQVTALETTIQHIAMTPRGTVNPGQGVLVSGTLKDSETGAAIAGATISMYCDTGLIYPCYDNIIGDIDMMYGAAEPASRTSSMAPFMYEPSYQEATTNADGSFSFEEEVAGYTIWLDYYADGYLNGSFSQDIYGQAGDITLDLTMESFVETSAHGVITDGQGNPIPGAYIELVYAGDMYLGDDIAMPGAGIDWGGMVNDVPPSVGSAPAPPMTPGVDGGGWADVSDSYSGGGEGSSGPGVDNEMMMRFRWENQQNVERGASDVAGFNGFFSVNADENGEYTIEGMPAGDYYMFASAYRHLPVNEVVTMAEDPSANEFNVTLEAVPVGVVEGVVTDANGDPIADCLVNATQPNVDPFTYSDANGHYRIENVPAGTWFISGYKTGYLTESVEQEILADQTVVVNLALEAYTPPQTDTVLFSGQVINGADATKLSGVTMVFTPVDNTLGGYYQHIVSGETGAYSCPLVSTEYNVLLQKEGYEDVYIRIWVDSEYPTMDFWMWPINSGNGGSWGGWGIPMADAEEPTHGGQPDTGTITPGTRPSIMPEMPRN